MQKIDFPAIFLFPFFFLLLYLIYVQLFLFVCVYPRDSISVHKRKSGAENRFLLCNFRGFFLLHIIFDLRNKTRKQYKKKYNK